MIPQRILEAFTTGVRWAVDHPSSGRTYAAVISASLEYAKTITEPPDANLMTEFGQGASTVYDALDELQERYVN